MRAILGRADEPQFSQLVHQPGNRRNADTLDDQGRSSMTDVHRRVVQNGKQDRIHGCSSGMPGQPVQDHQADSGIPGSRQQLHEPLLHGGIWSPRSKLGCGFQFERGVSQRIKEQATSCGTELREHPQDSPLDGLRVPGGDQRLSQLGQNLGTQTQNLPGSGLAANGISEVPDEKQRVRRLRGGLRSTQEAHQQTQHRCPPNTVSHVPPAQTHHAAP